MARSEGVAAIFSALEDAWNEADAAAYARLFAPDAVYITRAGAVWQGRPAIEEGHARALSGPLADTMLTLRPIHVAFPAPSVVVAQVDAQLSSETTTIRAVSTLVIALDGGRWSIVAAHTCEVAAVH